MMHSFIIQSSPSFFVIAYAKFEFSWLLIITITARMDNQVSQQAFQEEISNWQLTLLRESKKLKQLRKLSKNKFQLNSIDITLI